MPAPLGNKNGKQFQKGNKAATKNKGKKHVKTIVKEKMGLKWEDANAIVESNILEFLTSKNYKEREFATKHFSEFIKPKKREQTGELNHNVKVVFENIKEDE